MTWFASQIFANPTQKVLDIFSSQPVLSKGLFLLQGTLNHKWSMPQWDEHGFPPNGLLVVREVCNPKRQENPITKRIEVDWHGENAISWADFKSPAGIDVIFPPTLLPGHYQKYGSLPSYQPTSFLRFLKHFSTLTNTTVTYYHHETYSMREYDVEFAWIFGVQDLVLVLDNGHILQHTEKDTTTITVDKYARSVLMLVLKNYDLSLRSDYFAPHTRDFDWSRYKLQ